MNRKNKPCLRFSPTAWAKLLFMRDMTENEVGGFGISESDDLLYISDIVLVKQLVNPVSVKFDDIAVANFFEDQVDAGRKPDLFSRIWLHTHPGFSPEPSEIDEDTFDRVFGRCNWAIMFILSQEDKMYVRLRLNVGFETEIKIPACVDYSIEFKAPDFDLWQEQYLDNVNIQETAENILLYDRSVFGNELYDEYLDQEDIRKLKSDFWEEYERGR